MKILSAEQIRALDKYTIENEPINSIDLMERAAFEILCSIPRTYDNEWKTHIFCGMGNNGGDGLALARMLIEGEYSGIKVYVVKHTTKPSADFLKNEARLKKITRIQYIETKQQIPQIPKDDLVVDAIFGTGLTRKAESIAAHVIKAINQSGAKVYSVDIPSGLFCDVSNSPDDAIIRSTRTLTFHSPKLSFLFPENAQYVPSFKVLDIGLMKKGEDLLPSDIHLLTLEMVRPILKRRDKFSHKGTYGHALVCAGSFGKIGAAVLAVKAALRSGAGLVSTQIPSLGYDIMQITNPEAMVESKKSSNHLSALPDCDKYTAIGVGPGIGEEKETLSYLKSLLSTYKRPMVLDADALNLLSKHKKLLALIPANSILTPHPGEFKRMVGEWKNDTEKLQKQRDFSAKHKVVVVLKGAYTSIALPEGRMYFNSTGNPGMAKGGSGDVLTGVLTALLAQGYSSEQAALLGVYVHGLAGDAAKETLGEIGMNASDIIAHLPVAFKQLKQTTR